MKILYLDIDGVLNSEKQAWDVNQELPFIETDKIEMLNEILDRTKARIILSSTWRYLVPLTELQAHLELKGLRHKIFDITSRMFSRQGEIIRSIGHLRFNVDSIAILEDAEEFSLLERFCVRTDPSIGLTETNKEAVIKLLEQGNGKDLQKLLDER